MCTVGYASHEQLVKLPLENYDDSQAITDALEQVPAPETPNPKHQTQNTKPQTINPKLQTPNPKPQTPNPKPKISNPPPGARGVRQGLEAPRRYRPGTCPPYTRIYTGDFTLHPAPYAALQTSPYTLHPTPYTPHPTPCTLHHELYTLPLRWR